MKQTNKKKVHVLVSPRKSGMMTRLLPWLVLCWSHCVLTQPLDIDQYTALMSVFDGLGASLADILKHFVTSSHAGCSDADVCPRFNASSNCFGSAVHCAGGKVYLMCGSRMRSAMFPSD
jgi:hypothetical protein